MTIELRALLLACSDSCTPCPACCVPPPAPWPCPVLLPQLLGAPRGHFTPALAQRVPFGEACASPARKRCSRMGCCRLQCCTQFFITSSSSFSSSSCSSPLPLSPSSPSFHIFSSFYRCMVSCSSVIRAKHILILPSVVLPAKRRLQQVPIR